MGPTCDYPDGCTAASTRWVRVLNSKDPDRHACQNDEHYGAVVSGLVITDAAVALQTGKMLVVTVPFTPSPSGPCTHKNPQGVSCTRQAHGDEIRHRYVLSEEETRKRAAQISRDRLEAARSNQRPLDGVSVGKYQVHAGDAVRLDGGEFRGWLGIVKELYSKDDKHYAVVIGAKGSSQARKQERILPAEKLIYIRPGSEKARTAKIRAGRAT